MKNIDDYITISPSPETLEFWVNSSHITEGLREALRLANCLIVPTKGYIDQPELLYFPEGTDNLFQFLREVQRDGLVVEICIEDEEYQELARHADLIVLAATVVSTTFAATAADLFAEYIKRKFGSRTLNTNVKWDLTVVDEQSQKSYKLSYDGPASMCKSVVSEAVRNISGASEAPSVVRKQRKQITSSHPAKRKRKRK